MYEILKLDFLDMSIRNLIVFLKPDCRNISVKIITEYALCVQMCQNVIPMW